MKSKTTARKTKQLSREVLKAVRSEELLEHSRAGWQLVDPTPVPFRGWQLEYLMKRTETAEQVRLEDQVKDLKQKLKQAEIDIGVMMRFADGLQVEARNLANAELPPPRCPRKDLLGFITRLQVRARGIANRQHAAILTVTEEKEARAAE